MRHALYIAVALSVATMADAGTVGDLLGTSEAVEPSPPAEPSPAKAREAYERFLERAEDSPMRANALRRLADLELEYALDAIEVGAEPDFDKPVALYRDLLEAYPEHENKDQTLYQLARALDLGGNGNEALSVLTQLTMTFPQSKLADEAWFRQGELQFSARAFGDAAVAYAQVFDAPGSSFEATSRYKHAWSLFRLERFDATVASFDGLFALLLAGKQLDALEDAFTRGQREMLEDALRANSLAFVELGGPTAIDRYLEQRGKVDWAWLLYERLGEHYLVEESYAQAAESFAAYARRYPLDDRAPALQTRVIETYDAAGYADQALAARAAFVDDYRPASGFWANREPSAHAGVLEQVNTHLDVLTGHYHALVQGGDMLALDQAQRWYRVRIDDFATDPATPGQHFLLAEMLFDAGRYEDAAREYEHTAYEYASHERAAEAGYAAILAIDAAQSGGADVAEFALDSRLRFAAGWPDDSRAPVVLVNAAEMLFARANYAAATATARDALVHAGKLSIDQQRTAWIVQAHSQFELEDFAAAEGAYRNAIALTTELALQDKLNARLAAAIYSQGEVARAQGELAEAASHFQRVATVAGVTDIHPVALYDAASVLTELERFDEAAVALTGLRAAYPASKFAGEVAELLTGLYLDSGQPLNAAAELEGIAASSPDAGKATTARWQAAELYADNDDPSRYLAALETLATAAQTPYEDKVRAHEKLIGVHADDPFALTGWRQRVIALEDNAGTQSTDYTRTIAARAALALATPLSADFNAVSLTLPLTDSLPLKKSRLQAALAAYEKAAGYGVEQVSTASTYEIAELYAGFGESLMESERPADLDELALEEYEFLLEDQAFPFEEQAIELHAINAARAAEYVYDEWVAASFARLAELSPGRYARSEIDEPYIDLVAAD